MILMVGMAVCGKGGGGRGGEGRGGGGFPFSHSAIFRHLVCMYSTDLSVRLSFCLSLIVFFFFTGQTAN